MTPKDMLALKQADKPTYFSKLRGIYGSFSPSELAEHFQQTPTQHQLIKDYISSFPEDSHYTALFNNLLQTQRQKPSKLEQTPVQTPPDPLPETHLDRLSKTLQSLRQIRASAQSSPSCTPKIPSNCIMLDGEVRWEDNPRNVSPGFL